MKLYKVLLVASILGTISMPARMADLHANVDLGTDNTITANTSANIAIGNMNTTEWAMAVGSNNTAKNNSIIVGRDNSGNDSHIIIVFRLVRDVVANHKTTRYAGAATKVIQKNHLA